LRTGMAADLAEVAVIEADAAAEVERDEEEELVTDIAAAETEDLTSSMGV